MHHKTIEKLQDLYGYKQMQKMINNGSAWMMEGSYGRLTMDCIRQGKCILPRKSHQDYWGNKIPSRYEVGRYSIGSYKWSVRFWESESNIFDLQN